MKLDRLVGRISGLEKKQNAQKSLVKKSEGNR